MMGAASCDLPALVVSGGPMLNGITTARYRLRHRRLADVSEDVRAGKMSLADFMDAEAACRAPPGTA